MILRIKVTFFSFISFLLVLFWVASPVALAFTEPILITDPTNTVDLKDCLKPNPDQQQHFLEKTDPKAIEILRFWYEQWDNDIVKGGKGVYNSKWFPHGPAGAAGSQEVDKQIREKFSKTFDAAVEGKLTWEIDTNPYENLAYILLIDQFSRNMFRGTNKAYKYDNLGLAAADKNLQGCFFNYYFTGYQKLFVVYPFMHDENLASQKRSLEFLKIINEDEEHRYEFLNAFQKAFEHYQMIFMFDRFPHRNSRRGRPNKDNERSYLEKMQTLGFVDGSKW
ncbi:DUF924 family protein [Okeania sp.]|uniref:DUF924 family protein n=1 Tax=Okeania sp. TaxID=3100323 RepID=UPI002B4AE3C9|nr:DUF924 family protein [Okeania sp.]MEB3342607.1 DUF924 family protein [Okeania sp.]